MKKLAVMATVILASSFAQALDLRRVDHLSCSSEARGTFNLVDLQSEPKFIGSRAHDLDVLRTTKQSIRFVHPNGTVSVLTLAAQPRENYQGETYVSDLKEDTGLSTSMICTVL